jgi:hypothetical protein
MCSLFPSPRHIWKGTRGGSLGTSSHDFLIRVSIRITGTAGCRWLTPIILAAQEAEIRRLTVQSQLRQIARETLSQKTLHKKGLVERVKV